MESIFSAQPPKRKKGLGYARRHGEGKLTLSQKKAAKRQQKLEKMDHLKPLKNRKDGAKKAKDTSKKGNKDAADSSTSSFMQQSLESFEAAPAVPPSIASKLQAFSGKKRKNTATTTTTTTPTPIIATAIPTATAPTNNNKNNNNNNADNNETKTSKKKKRKKNKANGDNNEEKANDAPKNNNSNNNNNGNSDEDSKQEPATGLTKAQKKAAKKKASQTIAGVEGNPYLEVYRSAVAEMPADMDQLLKPGLSDERRAHLFGFLDLDYAEKYAWAIPDERALRIIAHFAPVVEIGCGRGYWGALLRARGVEWTGYDLHALDDNTGHPAWTEIRKGGPGDIKKHPRTTLMLSYPDDFEDSEQSLAAQCLKNFKGSTVILIGEHFGFTLQDNPWGRSAEALFQQDLAAGFHMLLRVPLPSWPTSWDAISVWKRTTECVVDDVHFRDIPVEERAEITVAAPAVAHLLA